MAPLSLVTVGEDGRHEERDQESESGGAKNADFPLIQFHRKILFLMFHTILITPNLKILKFLYTRVSGQTVATSHDLTRKGSCLEGKSTISGTSRLVKFCQLGQYIYIDTLQVQRFSKTRSFVKDQVLLDLFVRLKFSHLPTSLALTTCYNHLSPGKLGPWRFTVDSQF